MFESATSKVKRANHHIFDMERKFTTFVADRPHRFVIYEHPEANWRAVGIKFVKQIPSELSLIIGDAIHCLRTALDHMVWEMVGLDNGTQDRHTKLPTGNNRVSFEDTCKGIKTPSQWPKDAMVDLQIFPGGRGNSLWVLNKLDNADKHTLVQPVLRATSHPPFSIMSGGQQVMRMEGNVFVGGLVDGWVLHQLEHGQTVKIDDDIDCPMDIFIIKPGELMAVPAAPLLWEISTDVLSALASVARAVPEKI